MQELLRKEADSVSMSHLEQGRRLRWSTLMTDTLGWDGVFHLFVYKASEKVKKGNYSSVFCFRLLLLLLLNEE